MHEYIIMCTIFLDIRKNWTPKPPWKRLNNNNKSLGIYTDGPIIMYMIKLQLCFFPLSSRNQRQKTIIRNSV